MSAAATALGAAPRGAPVGASDVLTLNIGNKTLSGWQRVSVTRAMEAVPASFQLEVTERYPNAPDFDIKPGDPCTVTIGADLVITGYVDRYTSQIAPGTHTVMVNGRSKSEDLVDCSAFFGSPDAPKFQLSNTTVLAVAQELAKQYGITVQVMGEVEWTPIPQCNILLSETPWEVIDRYIRWQQLTAYDMPDGSVMLARGGSERMASGVALGANIEQAECSLSMDGRFSEYEGKMLSTDPLYVDPGLNSPIRGPIAKDTGVPRFRKKYIISEQTRMGVSTLRDRVDWEMNRNIGRSMALNCTIDGWRDAAGALWAPNHLAPISAKQIKLPEADWLIASVNYTRDENGQHTALVLMPKEAFAPEPQGDLFPLPPTIEEIERNNPVKPGPTEPATSAPYVGPGTA